MSDNSIRQIIRGLVETFGDNPDYVTVIIGVLVGDKDEVKTTEKEFSEKISDLLSANGFIQLSNYREKKGTESEEEESNHPSDKEARWLEQSKEEDEELSETQRRTQEYDDAREEDEEP